MNFGLELEVNLNPLTRYICVCVCVCACVCIDGDKRLFCFVLLGLSYKNFTLGSTYICIRLYLYRENEKERDTYRYICILFV